MEMRKKTQEIDPGNPAGKAAAKKKAAVIPLP